MMDLSLLRQRFSLRPLWKRRRMLDKGDALELPESEGTGETAVKGGGRLYGLWLWLLPVLLGLSLGWLASACLGVFLDRFENVGLRQQNAPAAAAPEKASGAGLDGFLAANPFRVSPMKPPEEEEVKPEEPEPEIIGSLAEAELTGTLPNVGAWVKDNKNQGKISLVLVGSSFDVYTLSQVTYREALFTREDDAVTLELLYGPRTIKPAAPRASAPRVAAAPAARTQAVEVPTGNVVAATPEHEGEVPSGLVSQLVQNPFDELKKVRLRPKNGEDGLEIQWIQKDSILRQLGVQKGDVIKGINGIPFTNMADIANSINSLMSSERFDVEVSRKGETTSLRYVVH